MKEKIKDVFTWKRGTGKGVKGFISTWVMNETLIALIALVIAIIFPIIFQARYVRSVMISCFIYAMLALSLNLITGFMGITSLGHAAFYGFGAYTAAILGKNFGLSPDITFLAAILVAGLGALLLGLPAIKAPARHLAIITLGFCEIVKIAEYNLVSLTGGPNGIHSVPPLSFFGLEVSSMMGKYYFALILLLVVLYVTSSIVNSRTGRAACAIRDNDIAAEAMGVNTYRYKLLIFVISAMLAGLVGAFNAHYVGFVAPNNFTFDQSIQYLSMVILGGMGSIPGSIIGALVLGIVPELLRDSGTYRQVLYGIVIVILMVSRPSGLLGKYNFKYIRQQILYGHKKDAEAKED